MVYNECTTQQYVEFTCSVIISFSRDISTRMEKLKLAVGVAVKSKGLYDSDKSDVFGEL